MSRFKLKNTLNTRDLSGYYLGGGALKHIVICKQRLFLEVDVIIIIIGGESHVGKTLLAQGLLEKYKIPYTSLDHIKMGLIRGYDDCGFVVSESDDIISEKMWNVVKGIIDTCKENGQNIILEGCYFRQIRFKN